MGAAALLLTGCGGGDDPPRPRPRGAASPTATPRPVDRRALRGLERRYGATLGVWALDTGSGRELAWRADRRFPFCSTFKGLAAAAVLRAGIPLDKTVRWGPDDLMDSSFLTRNHRSLPLRDVMEAAVRFSDGTAGNLLLHEIGGPPGFNRFLRGLGDRTTRMVRTEPTLATGTPGDLRDTSTPRALGADYREVVRSEPRLRRLMERNTTGDDRIRAGLPPSWRVADKTGTGGFGVANDIAVVFPPGREPLVIAIMSRREAGVDEALLADAARAVAAQLR